MPSSPPIAPLLHHRLTHPVFNSLLDQSSFCWMFVKISITFIFHMTPFYYALSSFLPHYVICPYVYSSLDPWLSHDPPSLCFSWFIHSHDPLHSWANQPIIVSLLFILLKWSKLWSRFTSQTPGKLLWPFTHSLMPLSLYCCVIYRLYICGVLSRPHFCIYTALGRCGRLSLAL